MIAVVDTNVLLSAALRDRLPAAHRLQQLHCAIRRTRHFSRRRWPAARII